MTIASVQGQSGQDLVVNNQARLVGLSISSCWCVPLDRRTSFAPSGKAGCKQRKRQSLGYHLRIVVYRSRGLLLPLLLMRASVFFVAMVPSFP